ncbi:beta-lactamase family protein [Cellulophaga baltica]|uniref:serine hydrolase domain-containing protein n=1 Tax=Cellulophaga TaxID=104264 RepID=UPI001C069D65|nr:MULTISPECIES: serine hydrolase domain-containing protein [Cellulophaga]MBU2994921.1 beta-lactamase family protein [Cellulophaga baltica]MDO6766315.1 serine hydrolase domain-containing protein [Cellulophaga sp. 1_MG-2023]
MKKIIFILFSLLLTISSCKNKKTADTITSEEIEESDSNKYNKIFSKIEDVLKENNVPSLSIGIVNNGNHIYKSFGVTNRNSSIKVDEKSVYQIASLSKMMTGIIANNSILEGKINLNEPITKYLSDKLSKKAIERLSEVKISDLLYHTSGLPRDPIYREARENGAVKFDSVKGITYMSEEDLIQELNEVSLENIAGNKYEYSNLGYSVLGYILELVNNKDFEQLVEEYISNKYELKYTFVNPTQYKNKIVTSYKDDGDRTIEQKKFNFGKQTSASGIYSNVEDLTLLMELQIKSFRSQAKNSLVPASFSNKAYTRRQKENIAYGFGLFRFSQNKDWTFYQHDGDADGFSSDYYFSPEKNIGLVFLSSSGGNWFGPLANEIFFEIVNDIK